VQIIKMQSALIRFRQLQDGCFGRPPNAANRRHSLYENRVSMRWMGVKLLVGFLTKCGVQFGDHQNKSNGVLYRTVRLSFRAAFISRKMVVYNWLAFALLFGVRDCLQCTDRLRIRLVLKRRIFWWV